MRTTVSVPDLTRTTDHPPPKHPIMSASDGHQPSPPINNLLQPDLYNRLDAQAVERTRVANTQLDERLRTQQKLLAKYRLAAERCHRREKERVRKELTRLSTKLPAISRIPDFRNKFLYGEGLRKSSSSGSVPDLHTRKIRGVPEDRCSLPFCERFFIHHLPSKKKYYKVRTPTPPLLLHAAGGDDGGRSVVSGIPAVTVSDVTPVQVDKVLDDVQTVNETHPNGVDHSNGAEVLTSQTELTNQISQDTGRTSSDDPKEIGRSVGYPQSVKNGNCSPRQNSKGEELPDRKLPRRSTGKTSLPPIQKQNVGLARSSPTLFQG